MEAREKHIVEGVGITRDIARALKDKYDNVLKERIDRALPEAFKKIGEAIGDDAKFGKKEIMATWKTTFPDFPEPSRELEDYWFYAILDTFENQGFQIFSEYNEPERDYLIVTIRW